MIDENRDALDKIKHDILEVGTSYLQHYMKVFAGEAESKKIDSKQVSLLYMKDGSDPSNFKYNDGVIEGLSDEERQKDWLEQLKKKQDLDEYVIRNAACKIKYTLSME